jgi:polyisoprenoid-binding protein YceI
VTDREDRTILPVVTGSRRPAPAFVLAVVLLAAGASGAGAEPATYSVVASKSAVRIHVGKAGALSFVGHRHEVTAPVTGTVRADAEHLASSSLDLTFASGGLRVVPEGEPKGDAPRVESVMQGPKVLDVARFPEIRFRSKQVAGQASSPGRYDLRVIGDLTLRGVTRELTIPVQVTLEGRTLTAVAQATVRHDQFGMEPVSAGGGTVKVANEIGIDFRIVAERP